MLDSLAKTNSDVYKGSMPCWNTEFSPTTCPEGVLLVRLMVLQTMFLEQGVLSLDRPSYSKSVMEGSNIKIEKCQVAVDEEIVDV